MRPSRSSLPSRPCRRSLPLALAAIGVVLGALAPATSGAADGPERLDAPRLARELRLSGDVVIEALVDSNGVVRATNVVRSQPVLDDSACIAVAARRFEPARDSTGRAIAAVRTVPLRFVSPREPDLPFEHFVADRCDFMRFTLDLDPRPDSTGRIEARWSARGSKSFEMRLVVMVPDGVDVDTTGGILPQRLIDDRAAPGWPAWGRRGKQLKAGTSGALSLRLPQEAWWTRGRIAIVALFHDALDREWVVRQAVYLVEPDDAGPLLVRDGRVPPCLAGPGRRFGPTSREGIEPPIAFPPSGAGERPFTGRR